MTLFSHSRLFLTTYWSSPDNEHEYTGLIQKRQRQNCETFVTLTNIGQNSQASGTNCQNGGVAAEEIDTA